MTKNILIISTSPRQGGNSETLADEFAKGAIEAGHQAEKICLYDKTINFCKGCLACQKTGRCIISDDANLIMEKMLTAQIIVFATPIYFYEMSGQMKTLLDRTNPLFIGDYAFRAIYLLTTAADQDDDAVEGAMKGLQGWISCFEKATLAGTIHAAGVDRVGAISNKPIALKAAYDMGKKL